MEIYNILFVLLFAIVWMNSDVIGDVSEVFCNEGYHAHVVTPIHLLQAHSYLETMVPCTNFV